MIYKYNLNVYLSQCDYNAGKPVPEYHSLATVPSYFTKEKKDKIDGYYLYIPREQARHGPKYPPLMSREEVMKIDHYELFIFKQIGSRYSKRPMVVLVKTSKSNRWIGIHITADGAVDWAPNEHKYAIRDMDSLDRAIVIGFCVKYWNSIRDSILTTDCNGPGLWLDTEALTYTVKKGTKRPDQKRKFYPFKDADDALEKYDDNDTVPNEVRDIFKENVVFI